MNNELWQKENRMYKNKTERIEIKIKIDLKITNNK
jgi:hypothetical protein